MMANHSKYSPDLLIAEKLCSGRWLVEPATGNIYSKDAGGYLKPSIVAGYPRVSILSTYVLVSRVVWIAVHGIPELPNLQIDHINENKLDNRIENLRLISPAGNVRRSRAILTYDDAEMIRREYAAGGVTQQVLADRYSMSPSSICEILNGKRYKMPKRIADIDEEVKKKIFEDICCRGEHVKLVASRYKVSPDDIIAAIEEQSLKIDLARRA
ncbi:MAG TPA: HNH endonuclease signature motif containing protein [Methanocorpusculum sp.]|nr:HNH endonuclease signature motif containing protein [Methanocorpusculum sp.]